MECWDNYWSLNKNGDCFSLDGKSDLSLILSTYWKQFFLTKNSNINVLDLACGNGFVGKCAIDTLTNSFCIGVDQSKDLGGDYFENNINKSYLKLLPNMPLDKLQFASEEFDLIVSQYGFEYSPNQRKILNALKSQLKYGGEIRLIIHSQESAIYNRSAEEIKVLSFLLNEFQIFEKLKTGYQIEFTKESLVSACVKTTKVEPKLILSLLQNILLLIDNIIVNKGTSERELIYISTLYQSHLARLQEQVKVSCNKESISELSNILNEVGFSGIKSCNVVDHKFGVVGWEVQACR